MGLFEASGLTEDGSVRRRGPGTRPGLHRGEQPGTGADPRSGRGLDEAALRAPVNDHWTVAGVFAHIAFWDGRSSRWPRRWSAASRSTTSDAEPEDVDWINDASRAAHARGSRRSSSLALALHVAEETTTVATLPLTASRRGPREPALPRSGRTTGASTSTTSPRATRDAEPVGSRRPPPVRPVPRVGERPDHRRPRPPSPTTQLRADGPLDHRTAFQTLRHLVDVDWSWREFAEGRDPGQTYAWDQLPLGRPAASSRRSAHEEDERLSRVRRRRLIPASLDRAARS